METRILKRRPLGNPERAWKQDNFVISTFSGICNCPRKGLQNLKEANFNMVEFGWTPSDRCDIAISAAEEVGIDVMVQDWRYFGGFQETRKKEIVNGEIEKFIENAKKYKRIAAYYVWDEPYYPDDIKIAREQTDIMEKLDPERMTFSVAIPSYNQAYTYQNNLFDKYMEDYVTIINPPVISLDFYPFAVSHPNDTIQLDESDVYKDLYLMRKWSLKKSMPLWFYYQGTGDLGACTLSNQQLAMQVHNALLYGAKGIQHYTVIGPVIDEKGERGEYFDYISKLNRRLQMWGRTLMSLISTGVFHSDDVLKDDPKFRTDYCDNFKDSTVFDGELPNRISVGEFKDSKGNKYIMVLNRDYTTKINIDLKFKSNVRLYEVSDTDGYQTVAFDNTDNLKIRLNPGDAKLYRVQCACEDAYLIDYMLEK